MIITELYNGQGFGNQLWSYVVTRVLALDKGLDFGIMSPEKFKGRDFMDIDFGKEVRGGKGPEGGPPVSLPEGIFNYYIEKDAWYGKYNCDVRDYDEGLLSISDNTKIEGLFQSEKFIEHRKEQIKNWFKVKKEYDCYDFSKDDICILNVRGGEYKGIPDLILPKKYWKDAVKNILRVKNDLKFIVITDDIKYANKILPEYQAFHFNIGKDYSIVKNAKYLIMSNSSFAFFPAWTSETVKYVIAPKYWARHNVSNGFWACAFNLYKNWMWQDTSGDLFAFNECEDEYKKYKVAHNIDDLEGKPLNISRSFFERVSNKIGRLF